MGDIKDEVTEKIKQTLGGDGFGSLSYDEQAELISRSVMKTLAFSYSENVLKALRAMTPRSEYYNEYDSVVWLKAEMRRRLNEPFRFVMDDYDLDVGNGIQVAHVMCACGHAIWTHLVDGRCLGCTGVCDRSGSFVVTQGAFNGSA